METNCQTLPLGEASITFIKEVLGDGLGYGLALSRLVTEQDIVGRNGDTFAVLTDDSDVEAVRNFTADQYNRGYVVHSGYTSECLASYIWEYLKEDENRLCLLENYHASSTDPWLERRKSQVVFLDTKVYHVATKVSGSADEVLNAIREAHGNWIFMGVLAQVQNSKYWLDASTIVIDDLKDVVAHATHVIVGAFDGEGYVVWQAKES